MPESEKFKKPQNTAIELLALGIDLLDGKPGEKGEKGEKGETGPAGQDSTVPGPKGEKGDTGPAGKDGADGKDGKDGRDGKDGKQGPKGDTGPSGKDGVDGKDAPEVTPEVILEVATPIIIQNVQKAVSSKTVSAGEVEGLAEFVATNSGSISWINYVSDGQYTGVTTTIADGDVLTYLYNSATIYRHITTATDAYGYPTEDAFYTTFSNPTLSGLIVARG